MSNGSATSYVLTEAERVTAGVATAVIGFAALAGNGLVFCAFGKFRKLRTPTNYFILNLAIFDFLIGCLPISFWASYLLTGKPRRDLNASFDYVYWLWECLDVLCGFGSATSLSFIALDRYICIKDALRYHSLVTRARVNLCLAFIWLYSLVPVCLSYLKTKAIISGAVFRYYIFIAGLVIQVCIMAFCYLTIFRETVRLSRQMQNMQKLGKFSSTRIGTANMGYRNSHCDTGNDANVAATDAEGTTEMQDLSLQNQSHLSAGVEYKIPDPASASKAAKASHSHTWFKNSSGWGEGKSIKFLKSTIERHHPDDSKDAHSSKASELKAARNLSFIMGAFLLTWTPFIVTVMLFQWNPKLLTFKLSVVTKCLHYLNSGVNPVLYTVFNLNFRKAVLGLFMCKSA